MGEELGSRWSRWWVHSLLQISYHDECFHAALHARLLGAAERERFTNLLQTQLDEAAFADNWTEDRAVTMEQAVAYALEDSGS